MGHGKVRLGNVSVLVFSLLLAVSAEAFGAVRLPAVIGDNMVLQRGAKVPIWGWAQPDEEVMVSVSWHTMQWAVKADKDGKWVFKMNPPKEGGPYEMTIKGQNTITVRNIMVGEVWVCSGQSNMEWPASQVVNAEKEVAAANYPNIRLFTVQKKVAEKPQSDCSGSWTACSPETVRGFSAVGYFFGRQLHTELNVPVGLINTSWGGTPAEAWTSKRVLSEMDDFRPIMQEIEQVVANPEPSEKKYQEQVLSWHKKIDFSGPEGAAAKGCTDIDFDDSGWSRWSCLCFGSRPVLKTSTVWCGSEKTSRSRNHG